MAHPETPNRPPGPAAPAHPQVTVRLSGTDGNAHLIVATVAGALRRHVGDDDADAFTTAAYNCGSYDELIRLAMATVTVT